MTNPATTSLDIGEPAPEFSLPASGDREIALSSLCGQWVVLYLYPKDDTSGCTKEALAFTQARADFTAAGAVVLGLSKDPVSKHEKFIAKHDLGITLLSDETCETIAAYGCWVEKSMYGRKYMGIERTTFLIDPDGIIRALWRKVKVPGHAEKVLAALKKANSA